MRHRKENTDLDFREIWKDEYRELSGEIHGYMTNNVAVPPEKANRLKALGLWLRSQSGD